LNKRAKKQLAKLPPPLANPERQRRENNATAPRTPGANATGSPDKRNRKATGKRFEVLNSFVDETLSTLCRGDIAVWLVLYRDTRDGTARTAQSDIGRRTGLSVRGVAKALRRLEKRGLLKVVYQGGLNRGMSRYRVLPLPDTEASFVSTYAKRRLSLTKPASSIP